MIHCCHKNVFSSYCVSHLSRVSILGLKEYKLHQTVVSLLFRDYTSCFKFFIFYFHKHHNLEKYEKKIYLFSLTLCGTGNDVVISRNCLNLSLCSLYHLLHFRDTIFLFYILQLRQRSAIHIPIRRWTSN
jgi:hypothetical protein